MSEEKQSSGFSWFLAGLGIGALIGVLYAPKAGRETREDLMSSARESTEYLKQRGREAADQVGGPLRIAQISGQVATIGLAALINLAAVLSISIGLLNLFPVPLLDGGHLLFYAVEAVRGRPLSERAQEMGFRIGLGLVLMLMVFATYNDILHLAAS